MMCQRIGRPPTLIIGFGRNVVNLAKARPLAAREDDDRHVHAGHRSEVAHAARLTLEIAERTAPGTSSNARSNPPGVSATTRSAAGNTYATIAISIARSAIAAPGSPNAELSGTAANRATIVLDR